MSAPLLSLEDMGYRAQGPNAIIDSMDSTMPYARTTKHAHELIDRMAPSQVSAVVSLLETMLDPVSRAIANAPVEDELESEEERKAVAESKDWLAHNPGQGVPHEEILAEFGLSAEDLKR